MTQKNPKQPNTKKYSAEQSSKNSANHFGPLTPAFLFQSPWEGKLLVDLILKSQH